VDLAFYACGVKLVGVAPVLDVCSICLPSSSMAYKARRRCRPCSARPSTEPPHPTMKIFGLASLALAASASFAVAGKLPKFERDLAAVALPLSQRTPQLAGRTDLQSTWDVGAPFPHSYSCCAHWPAQDASAMMIKMSLGDLLLEIPRLNEDAIKIQRALKTFRSMLLALNTAFAASVAEIIAQAGGGPLGARLPSMHTLITRSRRAFLRVSL
jgi:hypothetical protein